MPGIGANFTNKQESILNNYKQSWISPGCTKAEAPKDPSLLRRIGVVAINILRALSYLTLVVPLVEFLALGINACMRKEPKIEVAVEKLGTKNNPIETKNNPIGTKNNPIGTKNNPIVIDSSESKENPKTEEKKNEQPKTDRMNTLINFGKVKFGNDFEETLEETVEELMTLKEGDEISVINEEDQKNVLLLVESRPDPYVNDEIADDTEQPRYNTRLATTKRAEKIKNQKTEASFQRVGDASEEQYQLIFKHKGTTFRIPLSAKKTK